MYFVQCSRKFLCGLCLHEQQTNIAQSGTHQASHSLAFIKPIHRCVPTGHELTVWKL